LPEELWRELKMEAARQGKRFTEIVRQRLAAAHFSIKKQKPKKQRSLCGILKGVDIPDSLIEEAKRSLFPPPEKFLK
ncbi:MAG: hypothetical protein HY542_04325, partial [Deltaproteobacteria bacterium]|nr:hypothetical protein [Deltaproteobacteria bacterium]